MRRKARVEVMTNATETWRVIEAFPNYDVSDLGNVRSKWNGRMVAKGTRQGGTKYVQLHVDKKTHLCTVSNLVWITFREPVPKGTKIEHINGDPADDRLVNLKVTKEKKQTMKLTKEEFAAGLEATRNKEYEPGSVAAEIAADLKREKAISKRIETPETTSKAPEKPTITAKVETPERPVQIPPRPGRKLHGTIHGPLDQVVKMLGSVDLGTVNVIVTFEE